jgi:hypothetical protein
VGGRGLEHSPHGLKRARGAAGCEATLVERRVRRVFDYRGRLWQRVVFCRPVHPAEYDALCAAAAAPGDVSVQRGLGDTRSGAELLAEAAADRGVTMGRLAGSGKGRAMLDGLAAEVLRRCGGAVRAAREVVGACPEVEAWARGLVDRPWPPVIG